MKSFIASWGFRLAPESKERASDDQHKIRMHSRITFWDARLGLKEVQRVVILQA